MQRAMWEDTLEEFGYPCDRTRAPKAQHLSKKEWDNRMNALLQEINEEREQMQHDHEEQTKKLAEMEQVIEEQNRIIEKNRLRISQQDCQVETVERAKRIGSLDMSKYRNIARFAD